MLKTIDVSNPKNARMSRGCARFGSPTTLHLTFNPSNGAQTKSDSRGKSLLSLQLIDHRSAQASHFANLRHTKYLKPLIRSEHRGSHTPDTLRQPMGNYHTAFRAKAPTNAYQITGNWVMKAMPTPPRVLIISPRRNRREEHSRPTLSYRVRGSWPLRFPSCLARASRVICSRSVRGGSICARNRRMSRATSECPSLSSTS